MVELKIQKIGDGFGLMLPNEVLAHLNLSDGESVVLVEAPERRYMMTTSDSTHALIMGKAAELMDRYDQTLRDLAK
jgi:antitoxin component of MazEF toxin-antitoxin module